MAVPLGNVHRYLSGTAGRLFQQELESKQWQPLYFVLEGGRLKIFADDTLACLCGVFALTQQTAIYDVPGDSGGRKLLFYLHNGPAHTGASNAYTDAHTNTSNAHTDGDDEVLFLSATSGRAKSEWLEALSDALHCGFKRIHQPELFP
eukprot:CAMPEP_0173277862 /NCGR_PEP_ID=MMETSP1143-20121109/4308_1 /TAXON_ID=483371 /ORGANISM="non described non described, Strain CCMP2298" /LENGTH=147 /DNA_ID=CAMNT_0014214985 /DNA_START=25 /DNA_END=465 /DNA_ORIENTATION=+